jgi:hypothetical protein
MGIITCIICNMVRGITLNVMGFVSQWVQNVANFYSYFLLGFGVRFVDFFTSGNFQQLHLTGLGGPGFIFYSRWDGRKGCTLDFFLFLKKKNC